VCALTRSVGCLSAGSRPRGTTDDEEKVVFFEDLLHGDDEAESDGGDGGNGGPQAQHWRLLDGPHLSDGGRRAAWRPWQRVSRTSSTVILCAAPTNLPNIGPRAVPDWCPALDP